MSRFATHEAPSTSEDVKSERPPGNVDDERVDLHRSKPSGTAGIAWGAREDLPNRAERYPSGRDYGRVSPEARRSPSARTGCPSPSRRPMQRRNAREQGPRPDGDVIEHHRRKVGLSQSL